MTQKEFLADLEKNVYCRLRQSSVHGIGVFAIRDIPRDTNPFAGARVEQWSAIPLALVMDDLRIVPEVKDVVRALYVTEDNALYFPDHGLNDVNISYFLNHSIAPNIRAKEQDGEFRFITLRKIKKEEELFVDYRTYSDN